MYNLHTLWFSFETSAKKQRSDYQGYYNIEGLRNQKGIQRSLVVGIEQIGKSCFQSYAGKREHKPQGLNTFQAALCSLDETGTEREGKQKGSCDKSQHKFWKPFPQ